MEEEVLKKMVADQLLSEAKAEEIRAEAKAKNISIDDIVLKKKSVEMEKYTEVRAGVYGLPYANLVISDISEKALHNIPLEVARNYEIICFSLEGKEMSIGLTKPEDISAREAVGFLAKRQGLKPIYYLISPASFNKAIKLYKNISLEIGEALEVRAKEEEKEIAKKKGEEDEIEDIIKSAPVAKIVSVIIRHAVDGGASDIHIEPAPKECRVRYRIDGVLKTSLVLPKSVHAAIVARIKVMTNLKLDETRIPQDGRIRLLMDNKEVDFRVSILPLVGEEKVAMRILDTTKGAPTLEELGYMGRNLRIIREQIKQPNGMFFVTGPTGSGKSTTLFAVLNILNSEGLNISTLEDPVEYYIAGVNQSQVRPEIGYDFASGLRSLLRQDPDIVMVGEIRDNETAELAIHAGLTGHFVLTTLHTNNSLGSVPRLLDMKVEPFLLVSTLNVVVAQRLTRKICNYCRIEEKIPAETLKSLQTELKGVPKEDIEEILGAKFEPDNLKFFKGKGCSRCGNTGYSGRLAITEVIEINSEVRDMIMDKGKYLKLENVKKTQDFISMEQDGIVKALKGLTTIEEVLRAVRT